MFYLKHIVTHKYVAITKHNGQLAVEYKDKPDRAAFWSALDGAGFALARLESAGAVPPMTISIVKED